MILFHYFYEVTSEATFTVKMVECRLVIGLPVEYDIYFYKFLMCYNTSKNRFGISRDNGISELEL